MPLAHHNYIMTKQPQFSSDTGWHQDIRYWSYGGRSWSAVVVATPENEQNGCLYVIPGSHRIDLARSRFDDELFFRDDLDENRALIAGRVAVELDPGDVLFFHCRTLHAAGRNKTRDAKYSVVFTFRPGNNPPIAGSRSSSQPEVRIAPPRC
jgi:phytanoyl-CoA hydroxylase